MAATAVLKIDIITDAKKAVAGFDEVGSKMGDWGKKAAAVGAVAGVALAAGAAKLAGDAISAAAAGAKLQAATDQIIKSTGGAAKVTGEHVGDLANSLGRLSGVDDDLIQGGANLILTFKNVQNAGTGAAAVFDRATAAAVDLSAAGFGSVESASTMLGKALNDPVAGLTALGRAGVTFTQQQKDQIKTLVASNRTLEAQQIILKEVESQVGGVAAASATSADKLGVVWNQALEKVGGALLPLVDKLLPVLVDLLDALIPAIMPVVEMVAEFASTLLDALIPALEPLKPLFSELARAVGGSLKTALNQIAPVLPELIKALVELLIALVPIIPHMIKLALATTPLLPPLAQIITLIAQLATVTLPLLLRPIGLVVDAFSRLLGIIAAVINKIVELIAKAASLVTGPLGRIGDIIGSINPFALPIPGAPSATPTGLALVPAAAVPQRVTVNVNAGVIANPAQVGRVVALGLADYTRRSGRRWQEWS